MVKSVVALSTQRNSVRHAQVIDPAVFRKRCCKAVDRIVNYDEFPIPIILLPETLDRLQKKFRSAAGGHDTAHQRIGHVRHRGSRSFFSHARQLAYTRGFAAGATRGPACLNPTKRSRLIP